MRRKAAAAAGLQVSFLDRSTHYQTAAVDGSGWLLSLCYSNRKQQKSNPDPLTSIHPHLHTNPLLNPPKPPNNITQLPTGHLLQ